MGATGYSGEIEADRMWPWNAPIRKPLDAFAKARTGLSGDELAGIRQQDNNAAGKINNWINNLILVKFVLRFQCLRNSEDDTLKHFFKNVRTMIQVIYSGRLGNQLFQYCFGRILAEELGYKLSAEPIEGFPGTFEAVPGQEFSSESPIIFSGGDRPDLDELLRNPPQCRIIANAYFQLYAYYVRYLDRIRHWLRLAEYDRSGFHSDADTLVVHIRLGDYFTQGWTLTPESYISMIEAIPHRSLVILTDSPRSHFLEPFRRFRPEIVICDTMDAFKWMLNAPKLVISQSTFSWWAAILSNAEVWMPETPYSIWSRRSKINLRVYDNPRWTIFSADVLPASHGYVETPPDRQP